MTSNTRQCTAEICLSGPWAAVEPRLCGGVQSGSAGSLSRTLPGLLPLAAEKLALDGLAVDHKTLRGWLMKAVCVAANLENDGNCKVWHQAFHYPQGHLMNFLVTPTRMTLPSLCFPRASLTSWFIGISRGRPFLVSRAVTMLRRKSTCGVSSATVRPTQSCAECNNHGRP